MMNPALRFKADDGSAFPDWEETEIGQMMEVTSCKRVHQSEWTTEGIPFYRAREIVGLHNNEKIEPLFISNETYERNSKVSGKISAGDLLVTGVGTIGIQYLVKENDKFYFKDGNIIWFKNDESRVGGKYLYFVYDVPDIQKQIKEMSGKGTVHTYTIDNARKTKIPVPTLPEQQKIASFLSSIDERITLIDRQLDNLKQYKKSLLQQMFI